MAITTTAQQVGANVRAEAARRQINGSELARGVGLSQSAMSRRLVGSHPFTITELVLVADFLGLPIATFLPAESGAA